jgi:transcription initiation factor TFIIIB Brf1 subunit/transcription initiation factor TFIIB
MVMDVENDRISEELQNEYYRNHPGDVVDDTLKRGASDEYEHTGELLRDISTAAQRIKARDTVEEIRLELNLNEASERARRIVNDLDRETYSIYEADAVGGASTYWGAQLTNQKVTQDEIRQAGNIGKAEFRTAYNKVQNHLENHYPDLPF